MHWRIAHRGASGTCPENTVMAFRTAIAQGANAIELDVHLCRSGDVVVIHDDTLERTTNGHGRIKDHTLVELKQLDAGQGEPIPTLAEVFAEFGRDIAIFIETKCDDVVLPAARLITEYATAHAVPYAHMPVISFNWHHLAAVRTHNLQILTGATPGRNDAHHAPEFIAHARKSGMWSVNPNIEMLDASLIQAAHAAGLMVITWTANTAEDIRKSSSLGADGVMSDWPQYFMGA
ncbi:MAG: glycerophosphodiester phosphodiesterase [Alphaproteobacteria bacterium]